MMGNIEVKRRREGQRMRWLDSITDPMDMNLSKSWKIVKDREAWCATVQEVAKTQQLSNDDICRAGYQFNETAAIYHLIQALLETEILGAPFLKKGSFQSKELVILRVIHFPSRIEYMTSSTMQDVEFEALSISMAKLFPQRLNEWFSSQAKLVKWQQ